MDRGFACRHHPQTVFGALAGAFRASSVGGAAWEARRAEVSCGATTLEYLPQLPTRTAPKPTGISAKGVPFYGGKDTRAIQVAQSFFKDIEVVADGILKPYFQKYIGSWQTAWLVSRLGLENILLLNFEAFKAEHEGADVIAAVFDFVTAFPGVVRAGLWFLLEELGAGAALICFW